jgi:hypothetical protein
MWMIGLLISLLCSRFASVVILVSPEYLRRARQERASESLFIDQEGLKDFLPLNDARVRPVPCEGQTEAGRAGTLSRASCRDRCPAPAATAGPASVDDDSCLTCLAANVLANDLLSAFPSLGPAGRPTDRPACRGQRLSTGTLEIWREGPSQYSRRLTTGTRPISNT